MSADWSEVTLGSVTTWLSGGTPNKGTPSFWNGDIPWISANSMYGTRFYDSDLKITESGLSAGSRLAPTNSILLLVRGGALHNRLPVGMACRDLAFNQDVKALIPDSNRLDPWFLLYWLVGNERFLLDEVVEETGIGAGKLDTKRMQALQMKLPPFASQKRIAQVARSIDDKIDLNRRINQTLEAMAQAIFKSWFVDFDPVKAKIAAKQEGRDPLRAAMTAISGNLDADLDALQPEQYDQLAATAALFPYEMEESELGEIPKGWKAKKFGDFIDRISVGKKFDQKTALVEGLVPILDQGKSGIIGFHNESPGVRASLEKPIVVFANHTCYMRLITFDFSAIQNVLPFVGKDVDTVWAYYATKDAVKFSEYKGHWPDFVLADAVVPQANLTVHFRKILQPLISQMRSLELESEKLAVLRDTLLPKLLSGELSVTATTAEAEA